MTEAAANRQTASGSYIAQAGPGAIATVTVYQLAVAAPVDEAERLAAAARLADLPLDAVPAPAALPSGSRMVFSRNALFVGREGDLKSLAAALKSGGTAAVGQIAAATGLGGIGKTQLANEFVHRYGQYFAGGVFWLNFADPDAIPSEIASCGGLGALDLRPDFANLPLPDQVRLVASAWYGPLPRLLIFDNCEDEDLLARWRPVTGGSRVLVTSRRAVWRGDLGVQALRLGVLSLRESVDLLRGHRPDLLPDDQDLAAIADELGYLPLALHLAGSFLARYRHEPFGRPGAYLAQLRRADLLEHRSMTAGGGSPTGHEQHVARSFALSYDRLDPADGIYALALSVLTRATCFAAGEPIPRELLRASLDLPDDDGNAVLRSADAMGRLVALGLVEQDEGGRLMLHRLLAMFVRGETEGPDLTAARVAVERAVLTEARRLNKAGYPAPLLAWQPHLRTVAENAAAAGSEHAGSLYNALGIHLRMVAEYRGARAAFERALAIDEKAFGPDHPEVAVNVSYLGNILLALGDLPAARATLERALVIAEKAYGPNHPNVAAIINDLGLVLSDLGDLDGSRAALQRALVITENTYGPNHPSVAANLNNLGDVLRNLGDLAGARANLERAIAIAEKIYGTDHPNVARGVNNLGVVLHALGDLPGARAAFEQAIAIIEKAYGPEHPIFAADLNNLGSLLHDLGDLNGARAAFERALAIDEKVYGLDHPKITPGLNNLGLLLMDLGDLNGARAAHERALAINEKSYGPDHPRIAIDLANLGSVVLDLGDLAGARAAVERALAINERAYGRDHPEVATCVNNLGRVLQAVGDLAGARANLERAIAVNERAFGPSHPNVAMVSANLGLVLKQLGDLACSRAAFERALAIDERVFGSEHARVGRLRKELANLGESAEQ